MENPQGFSRACRAGSCYDAGRSFTCKLQVRGLGGAQLHHHQGQSCRHKAPARQMQTPAGHVNGSNGVNANKFKKTKATWGAPTVQIPPDPGMKCLDTGQILASHPLPLFVFHILESNSRC